MVDSSSFAAARSSDVRRSADRANARAARQKPESMLPGQCPPLQPIGGFTNANQCPKKPAAGNRTDADRDAIDEQKLHDLLGRAIVDFGGVHIASLVLIGDRLGLYRALASYGALTSTELAARTETHERYVREWLNAQAASRLRDLRRADRAATRSRRSRRSCSRTRMAPRSSSARSRPRSPPRKMVDRLTERVPHRRRHRLARARSRALPRHRALLPLVVRRQSRAELDPVARRRRGEAATPVHTSRTSAAATARRRS